MMFLYVRVGNRDVALRLEDVEEVVKKKTLTPIPLSPPGFEGVMLLRGSPVPVYSLSSIMGEEKGEGKIVVVLKEKRGLLVDEVLGIKKGEPTPLSGSELASGTLGDTVVLDIEKIKRRIKW
ncbi:hypothetical protein DRQ16_01515 [bacterium]|nr:MAG: hypothetical protein DRQ16_01515 [bacterium]